MDPRYKSPATNVVREEEEFTFRDLDFITRSLQWLLRAGAVVVTVSLWSAWLQLSLLGGPFTEAEGQANDLREGAVGGLQALVTITAAIVFGRWILLAHRNLPALGAENLDVRPGWAIGWFFIPVANLWKPYQAMRTLWKASRDARKWNLEDSTWILPVWWTLWLVSSFLGNYLMRNTFGEESIQRLTMTTQVAIANCIVDVPLYIVASVLVGKIWQGQLAQRQPGAESLQQPVISS
jgi:hypothetical protein